MAVNHPDFTVVAINDLSPLDNLAYLLRYDTAYGRSDLTVAVADNNLVVNGQTIVVSQERNPEALAWQEQEIDIVVEATGVFASYEKAKAHLAAGAKRVVVSAPIKDEAKTAGVSGTTILMGVNDGQLKTSQISSNASCTTNAVSPLMAILKEAIGIEKAILNTVHAYTVTQQIIDGPSKDFRKGRAAAQNIVPTSTGAAIATTKAHTDLTDKFDGIALRVPVPVGSIVDVTFIASQNTTVETVNETLRAASTSSRWQHLFAVTDEPIVSSDIIGARYAAIADLPMTRVVDGNLVKVLAWYDNETSYTHTLVEHVAAMAKCLQADTAT